MTVYTPVLFDFSARADGSDVPVYGTLSFKPTRRQINSPSIITDAPFTVLYQGEPLTVDLAVLPADIAWEVTENIDMLRVERLIKTEDADPVNYADLPSLDPADFSPLPPPPTSAWVAALAAEQAERVAADTDLQDQIDGLPSADGKMDKAANLSDVADVAEARDNLELGTAATQDSGAFDPAGSAAAAQAASQPVDADLTDIAALTPADGDVPVRVAGHWLNRTMVQLKTALGLTKTDVGLSNVDNTSDAAKPVSTAQAAADALALAKAQNLADLPNAGTARTNLGLGTAATQPVGAFDAAGAAAAAQAASQPLDPDLSTIAGLTATTDNILQAVAGAWASRTPAQVKAALAIAQADVAGLVAALAAKLDLAGGTLTDGANIALGSTTGTKFGTATTQKCGFYNATPIVQPSATTDLGTVLSNLGLRAAGTAFGGRKGYASTTTTPYTQGASPEHLDMDATAGNKVVNLIATSTPGYIFTVKKVDATANTVTINAAGGGAGIDGAASVVLSLPNEWITVLTTGVSGTYRVIAGSGITPATQAALNAKEPTITAGTTAQYLRGDKSLATLNQDAVPDGTTNKAYTGTEKTKLAGVATGATANQSDATTNAAIALKRNRDLPSYVPGTVTGQYLQRSSLYNVKASNTRRIRAALGAAGVTGTANSAGLARVAVLGDSKSDTFNGSNTGNGGYDITFTKWPWLLRKRLAAALGTPLGGTGFVKCYHGGVYDPRWSFTGTWVNDTTGPFSYTLNVGDTATFSTLVSGESGTVVEILYSDYSTATWTVSVDGATSGAGYASTVNTNTNTVKKLTLTGLPDTPHTVTITNSNAYMFIYGACIRKTTGVVLDNFAVNGGWAAMYATGAAVGNLARFYLPDPDLIIVPIGINDLGDHAGGQNKSVATAIADLAAVLATWPNSNKLLVLEDRTTNAISQSNWNTKWDAWAAALYQLADSIDAPLLDLTDRYGATTDTIHASLMIDGVHQSAAGDVDWSIAIAGFFDAALTGPPPAATRPARTVNSQTGTTYTFVAGDAGNVVDFSNTSAITATVPPNSSVPFPIGTEIEGTNLNTGDLTFVGGSGVTVNSANGLNIRDQYGPYCLRKTGTNTWVLMGRVTT